MGTRRASNADVARDFFGKLASDGAWHPTFVIQGDERFLVDQALGRLTRSVFPDGRDDFNFVSLHGSESKGADIASAAAQSPMFATKRVVIVRGAERLSASEMEPIAQYAEDPNETTLLVLEALKLDGRQKNVRKLLNGTRVASVSFGTLYANEAAQWVKRQSKQHNLNFVGDVGGYLVDALGTSLGPLDKALERIDLYLGDSRDVTIEAARQVVPDTRSRSVFELTDHLAAKQLDAAVGCFHRMIYQGESPIGAVSMIARQFRQLLLAKDGQTQGLSGGRLAAHIGCPPFKVRDYESASRRFTEPQLRTLLRQIAETDLALKSSRLKRELIVERLFVRICGS